jgi:hypothetical protein
MNLDSVTQLFLGIFAFIISSIAGIIGWFVKKLTSKVEQLDDVYNVHEVRLSVAENRINGIEERLKSIEKKLDRIYSLLQRTSGENDE